MIVAILLAAALATSVTAWITGEVLFAWPALAVGAAAILAVGVPMLRERRTERLRPNQADGDVDLADKADAEAGTNQVSEENAGLVDRSPESAGGPAGNKTDPSEVDETRSASSRPRRKGSGGPAPTDTPAVGPSGRQSGGSHADSSKNGSEVVCVLPGRRRFHRPSCELIAGRQADYISIDDARDEGFSACSRCHDPAGSN